MSSVTVPAFQATIALLALLSAASAQNTSPSTAPELVALQQSMQRTKKVTAKFTQVRHLAALHDALMTEGALEYQNGGRLVWRTFAPSASELVMEGAHVTISYPGMGSAQTIDFSSDPGMARVFETIRSVLQADLDRLGALFTVTVRRRQPLSISLSPRSKALAETLKRIQLDFDGSFRLVHVTLGETDGDSTEISFREQVIETSAN